MSDETTRSRTGRKRSEESRQAILDAAFELLGEVGYGRMAVEGIASRAGSGKQTIYRWWPGKADVLLEALQAKADLYISIADQGSYEQELRTFLTDSARLGRRRPEITEALRALMAEAQVDRRFAERFDVFLWGRRAALTTIVERASGTGATIGGSTSNAFSARATASRSVSAPERISVLSCRDMRSAGNASLRIRATSAGST
jgi:AcrR family transcriptional regulator